MTVLLRLLDLAGSPTGQVFEFDSHDCFIFGRDVNAHCRITSDPAISRHHFLLEIIPPEVRVKDLGSTNGIHVNGVLYGGKNGRRGADGSLPVVRLRHGDRIRIGKTQIAIEQRLAATEPATFHVDAVGGAPAAAESVEAAASGFDRFCDGCGKLISEATAVIEDGKRFCLTCRLVDDGGLSRMVRAHTQGDEPPSELPGYEIGEKIGKGGMGVVYRGRDPKSGREVAIKIMKRGVAARGGADVMFRREIAISRTLDHPRVVSFLDGGAVGATLYLVMEFMAGGSLWRRLRRHGRPELPVVVRWMRQMTEGLAAAHERQLVHRDLKPANILLDGPGDGANVKISDFGLAKCLGAAGLSGFTATGTTAGTATCMPPEQLSDFKRVSAAGDVFSLGATFYEMLAGRSPYNIGRGKDPVAAVLAFDLTPLARRRPELPAGLSAIVDRCLLRDPGERYPEAGSVQNALDGLDLD